MKQVKPKRCRVCKKLFTPSYSTLQIVCSPECAAKQARVDAEKKKLKELKDNRLKMKESLKTLTQYEEEAKKVFQRYIRLRDAAKPCISCMKYNPPDWCGGHYFPAGQYSGLIFDERNCHGQCNTYCNKHLSGNQINYRIGLVNRYGEDFVKELESDAVLKRNYKYTKDELIAKKLQYELKIKELKKKDYGNNF